MTTVQAAFSGPTQQRGWQGIVPLHSTRAEVEAQLGKGSGACNCRYGTATSAVVIDYAKARCQGPPHGWNVPAGTVLQITVYPKSKSSITQLGLKEKEYLSSHGVGETATYFTNLQEGIKYSVHEDEVQSISYIPSRKDINLRCQGFPAYDGGIREYQPYAAFSAKAELFEQRLGEFAAQLAENDKLKAFIISYVGRVAKPGEPRLMAARAKQSLTRLGIPESRITMIDGGFRETAEYELFLLQHGVPAPAPTPTIASKKVRIPRQRRVRRR